jgi:hypothetical protein
MGRATFWTIFQKLIWSPCLRAHAGPEGDSLTKSTQQIAAQQMGL